MPGGTASYPSSVLMNAIPAKVAGVDRIVMVVPAPDGAINPAVLAAARRAGVDEVYRIGGAQAVAALAYGTQTIAPVAKIVGPGNAYVAAAKRAVFGTVGIDMIAGPSEVLVIADATANPQWVAADLLAQAEHDSAAQSIVITLDDDLGDAIVAAVDGQLEDLPRADIAGASWRDYGAVIAANGRDEAVALANRIAAEHLELAVDDPETMMQGIRPRRRDLPRPPYAGGHRRLCRRIEPCAPDGTLGTLFLRPVGAGLRQAHLRPVLHARGAGETGACGHLPGAHGGVDGACPFGCHTLQSDVSAPDPVSRRGPPCCPTLRQTVPRPMAAVQTARTALCRW